MRSIVGMKAVAKLITEETQEGHNTAARVGGLFEDIVDYLDSADPTSSLKIDRYVTTGTRIAKFTVGGEETTIFAPSNSGSGGGGGGSSDGSEIPEIQTAIEALDDALDSTTKLANDEKKRLDDLVKGIGEDISGRMKDALEYAEWIRGNHPEGEVFFESGWNDKAKEFMQTVGLWDTDEATTRTRWSYYKQNYNTIAAAVSAINQDGNFSTFLQGLIEETITDESVKTSISNTYAKRDDLTDVINWMFSGLTGSASEYETYNELVSAAKNGEQTAISEVRTYVEKVKNGEVLDLVASADIASKVDDALAMLRTSASSNTAKTYIFSTIAKNSDDIATIITEATNGATGATIAAKFANWRAGLVTTANKSGSIVSLLAANNDNTAAAAIAAMINDAGSSVTIDADHIDLSGLDILLYIKDPEGYISMTGQGLKLTNRNTADYSPWHYDVIADGYTGEFKVIDTPAGGNDPAITFKVSSTGTTQYSGSGSSAFHYFSFGNEEGSILENMVIASVAVSGDEFVSLARSKAMFNVDGSGYLANNNITWNASGELTASEGFKIGNYSFKVVTIGGSSYLRISTGGTTGLYMDASGRLGINDSNTFKVSFDMAEYHSHHSNINSLGDFLTYAGSDLNNYTIRNGLIVSAQ